MLRCRAYRTRKMKDKLFLSHECELLLGRMRALSLGTTSYSRANSQAIRVWSVAGGGIWVAGRSALEVLFLVRVWVGP